jgi:GTP pyrophosphokinase
MAELAAQIRSRQSLVLKALPAPVSDTDRKALSLATDIARTYYPSDTKYLGEPLPLYYLELARVTASAIGLGTSAVISAMLSGIREGSEAWERIDTLNDPSIKEVILGLSRVTALRGRDFSGQAENFRKLLLSLADDGRVILIALAERLLVMRRLDWLSEKERLPVASETYFLFAPLAHRLGY